MYALIRLISGSLLSQMVGPQPLMVMSLLVCFLIVSGLVLKLLEVFLVFCLIFCFTDLCTVRRIFCAYENLYVPFFVGPI